MEISSTYPLNTESAMVAYAEYADGMNLFIITNNVEGVKQQRIIKTPQ
ncbi:MAG: hypothetical protein WC716_04940 [Chitinophagaceae bacterium]|jgi:hypothetical protein